MILVKTVHKVAAITITGFLLNTGIALADSSTDFQLDKDSLTHWQMSYDTLRDMTPKWGKQGVDAFKVSIDAGVPMLLLDVRTPGEWKSGHIKNSLLINLNELPNPENLAKLPGDRNTIIGIYCKAGHRSSLALLLLHQLGYKNAINMSGGIQAWRDAGYPITIDE